MRLTSQLGLGTCLALATLVSFAQDSAALLKTLNGQYSITKVTDDRSDIVTAGAVLVLHKDGLLMYSTPTATPPLNLYKDGRIQQNAAANYFRGLGGMLRHGGDSSELNNIAHRRFVSGEKFWVTAIELQQDGILFSVYSDPFNDVRYYGLLKFSFPKNAMPPASALVKQVEEVITVDGGGDGGDKQESEAPQGKNSGGANSGGQQSASAPLAPIAPPAPPTDQPAAPPKTISIGQTKDAVLATWGQPGKTVKLGAKEIYYYPDMKVVFVGGKVSDVQ